MRIWKPMEYLFQKQDLRGVFEHQKEEIKKAIQAMAPQELLNTDDATLHAYLTQQYDLEVPTLYPDQAYICNQGEAQIDVSKDPRRAFIDRGKPFLLTGTEIIIAVPYTGERELFFWAPSAFDSNPPRATITDNEVHFSYQTLDHNPERIRGEFDRNLQQVQTYLTRARENVSMFKQELPNFITSAITQRKTKLGKDQQLVTRIGLPIKKAAHVPETFKVPVTPKKILPKPVPNTPSLEYTITDETYQAILTVINDTGRVFERLPSTYAGKNEEALRDLLILILEPHFTWSATGETFNKNGKTDILIRHEKHNVFVAECKYWGGQNLHHETITQLLSYLTWRDTKTAIIYFVRNKEITPVFQTIKETTPKHPNFVRWETSVGEAWQKAIFHLNGDKNRHLTLSILSFHLPDANS